MSKTTRTTRNKKNGTKRLMSVTAFLLALVFVLWTPVQTAVAAESVSCKSLYTEVKKNCKKGAKKVKKLEKCTFLSRTLRKSVEDFYYASDDEQVYCVCIVRAKSSSDAKEIEKEFKAIKKEKSEDSYLEASEKKQVKTAQCGRSGSYVWYICLDSKTNNKNAVKALKKAL